MLFGHIENKEHRIDHILRIRSLQDSSLALQNGGGFNAFIPLVYQRDNNYLKNIPFLGSVEILKTMAISRILLDNINHIKAYWATSTLNLALVAQEFGADDLDGTIEKDFYGNILTPFKVIEKGLTASAEEVEQNPRARSAKLRVAEKIESNK